MDNRIISISIEELCAKILSWGLDQNKDEVRTISGWLKEFESDCLEELQ